MVEVRPKIVGTIVGRISARAIPEGWSWTMSDRAEAARAMKSDPEETAVPAGSAPGKDLTPAARRALDEAALRRAEIDARAADLAKAKEHQGRGGLEPVRYDDWEVKGLASDF
jgi:hypothetical protein